MGKKGKKGGKGGKKKEPELTFQEAILAYKVNILEKKLEDLNYEVRGWEEKNKRAIERNDRLKSEQELLVENLLRTAKDFDKLVEGEEMTNKSDVIVTMKGLWQRRGELEKEVAEIEAEIQLKEKEIDAVEKQVEYWSDYRDRGQNDQQKHITLLQQELADLQSSFELMASHLELSLDTTKSDIKKKTDNALDQQKYLAAEKAMAKLDKQSRQEVLDNDWLKREVEIHKRECDELYQSVSSLEQENLKIMSELFDCRVEDLKISRNLFLTQFEEGENLEETGILEMDLTGLSLEGRLTSPELQKRAESKDNAVAVRPKSATLKAIEDKILPLLIKEQEEQDEEEETDDEDETDSVDMDVLSDDFFVEDINDYLKLGPLELKLLNIEGKAMKLHEPTPLSEAEIQAKDCQPDVWPVTKPMLKELL
ncbi:coiled-coil domain-containing protein 83-like [Liolophura sinensis]|uniref:coiled-coil domain-containing protein 83-like n=1 Tax=Liolophura sinensis TaxID=3198878 RepID=UPI003157F778